MLDAVLRGAFLVLLLLFTSTPADAADDTTRLLQQLDGCDSRRPETWAPKLNVLLALADGRSSDELAALLGRRRDCTGWITTYGNGSEELLFVGGLGPGVAPGALLWVDRGYWRAAALPLGYIPGTRDVRHDGAAREVLVGIGGGGSGGTTGVTGIRIEGATATTTLRFVPGAELTDVRLLDDDHLYIAGRTTTDPLFTWMSHPGWPYGAQWLYERRDGAWVEVAHRQSRDPAWLMTGFVGALFTRDIATMRRFSSDAAVAVAIELPALDRRIDGLTLLADRNFMRDEQLTWAALPDAMRTTGVPGPVYGWFRNYDYWVRTVIEVGMRFDRDGDGWIIGAVTRLTPVLGETTLVP